MRTLPLVLVLTLAPSLPAADWPQFLGPDRDNTSPEKVAPWTGAPKVVWKQPVGDAHSSPVVVNGVVYAFHQPKGTDADALTAFDAATGEKKWEKSYDREKFDPPSGPGPRGTPAVAGGKVYTLGGTGVLACWDPAKAGEVVWKVDTLKRFDVENLVFGVSTSPLVSGGKVFVNVGGKGAGVVAFDTGTGAVAWKATDDGQSYASPILVRAAGKEQVVFNTRENLIAFDPATGDVFWKYPFRDPTLESATTPLKAGDLLVGSSVKLGSVALKLTETDGKPAVGQAWRKRQLNCYFSTPVAAGKHLYMLNGVLSITPSITLRCVEAATGKVLWEKANVGSYHAALVRTADDHLLMFADTGHLTLLKADPAGYKELARSKVCGPTWAHPALVGGKLYIRDEKELICLDLGGGGR